METAASLLQLPWHPLDQVRSKTVEDYRHLHHLVRLKPVLMPKQHHLHHFVKIISTYNNPPPAKI